MSEENKATSDKALAAQGAAPENLSDGSGTEGAPKAPAAPANTPPAQEEKKPKPEGMDEEHGSAETAEQKAEREAKETREKKEKDGPLREYITLEDPTAQAAINLLKEAGVGPNEANEFFAEAIKTQDLSKIDRKALEARVGKDKATLILAGVEAHYNGTKAHVEGTVKQTLEIFGGEQNWIAVRTWAHDAEKADPKLKAQIDDIRDLLDEGGAKAAAGARELLRLYNAAPTTKGLGTAKLVQGDSTGNVIGKPLSRADYITELKAAHARNAKPAEIAAIDARRRAGKSAGL